ncbi:Pvc16 family protein [Burkholderia ubonensis]|uniref:Pvc16 family protein n=1 Tax=Burkholderia ubonensis TaxID=101571 RepID=UPI0009B3A961|nr:Pvc16 family protein [Burkholderia ubonensis]
MATAIDSDLSVIQVNQAVYNALSTYVDDAVDIRFDLPDPDSPPIQPTISVFLYDMYEDLQLKTAESRQYNEGKLQPSKVNVCCNYLIMYWDKPAKEGSPDGGAINQATVVMNQVLNALINNRQLKDLPGAFTRVIPPKEQLNSLGNFWQSLGNRPRLMLNFSATVPVSLTDHNEVIPAVESQQPVMERKG